MDHEITNKLYEDFPLLYCDHKKRPSLCWGFECCDGWELLLRKLSAKLETLIKEWIKEHGIGSWNAIHGIREEQS